MKRRSGGSRRSKPTRPIRLLGYSPSAATIARSLASNRVSPKGPASGMRMLTYFINRAGRGLSATRRAELQKAKTLLSRRIKAVKESG